MTGKKQWFLGATLGAASLALLGCGGGSGTSTNNTNGNTLAALTDTGRLLFLDSRRPASPINRGITGLTVGESLVGIDFRFSPAGGPQALYGLSARPGGIHQLYVMDISGGGAIPATPVGPTFTLSPPATAIGFDFNPNVTDPTTGGRVDRIRLVTADGRNLRLVPNTGAVVDTDAGTPGVQFDGALAYDASDVNAGATPRVVGAAYTNNDLDIATGTINYALDSGRNLLVTQGRPDDPAIAGDQSVSPNTGRLFTVGSTGVAMGDALGFDVVGSNNAAFAAFRPSGGVPRLYGVDLATGATRDLGIIGVPTGSSVVGLAGLS